MKKETEVNRAHTLEVQEHDIAIVNYTINGHSIAVLIDDGSNTNLVTRNILNKKH